MTHAIASPVPVVPLRARMRWHGDREAYPVVLTLDFVDLCDSVRCYFIHRSNLWGRQPRDVPGARIEHYKETRNRIP